MLKLNLDTEGLIEHFITDLLYERQRITTARTLRDKKFHAGRVSAFEQIIETCDCALRSKSSNSAVELRTANVIINEYKKVKYE